VSGYIAKRKQAFAYNNYLKLGFTSVVVNGETRPQFVLCLEVLAHGSLKKLNYRVKYVKYVGKILELFKDHQIT